MDHQKPRNTGKTELTFQPITEGLGFHPFSDGLPYAPISKGNRQPTSTSTASSSIGAAAGAGAVAAGPPKVAVPPRLPQQSRPAPIPQISVPIAKRPMETDRVPILAPSATIEEPPRQPEVEQNSRLGYVYLIRRLIASGIDMIFSASLFGGAIRVLVWKQDFNLDLFFNSTVIIAAVCFWFAFHWTFVMLQEVVFKTSIGKRMVGLGLRGTSILIFLRSLFYLPSISLLGIGLLWSLFDRQKRCWHDRVVDLQPTDLSRY